MSHPDDVLLAALAACGGVQAELGRRIGADRSLVCAWWKGRKRPGRRSLLRMAEVAGLDPGAVLADLLADQRRNGASA